MPTPPPRQPLQTRPRPLDHPHRHLRLTRSPAAPISAGSVFLNPLVAATQAARWSPAGCPVHTDSDGQLRASAGWLLEHVGYRPGQKITDGVRCSERRTLTLTAHNGVRPSPH
ncbi:hypothetical protein ACFZCK_11355 [Kitasatospora purpeofusca]|uniref:hypothetical protein n=1 Tax=Kitasatospora purpeofusca TaxID=67352 RepID=UPI0036EEF7A7